MGQASYKTTKFHRESGQRKALIKGLADSLVIYESIETTLSKAKAVASYTEKLITKAKKAKENLHIRRKVINGLNTLEAAHKLVDEIAPKLAARNGGYLRIEKTSSRKGDGTQLARVSFVDDLSKKAKPTKEEAAEEPKPKKPVTKRKAVEKK